MQVDEIRYESVRKRIDVNLSERHLRGGVATKNKYKKLRRMQVGLKKN